LRANEYACKKLDVEEISANLYTEAFNVTRADIDSYILLFGLPGNAFSPRNNEGLRFTEEKGKWVISWHERGSIDEIASFDNQKAAEKKLTDVILNLSSTGLNFSSEKTQ